MKDLKISSVEVCGRCGHVAGAECPACGVLDPLLGGSIWYDAPDVNGVPQLAVIRLCHTYSPDGQTSCYATELAERSARTGRWAT